ncbi:hypothetical protein M3201_07860 [Paenibacillus motobuensis]|nr:hypothetical protein [Paenibacillus lutimineralis]MCM3646716.1 hypothetical protein [Paenibacillus motobuensis]
MEHLGLNDEEELRKILRSIRIQHSKPGISMLIRDMLNSKLMLAVLKPINFKMLVNPYNDLIVNCASKGSKRFNRETLLNLCRREGLYTGLQLIIDEIPGIRSFLSHAENLEEETPFTMSL